MSDVVRTLVINPVEPAPFSMKLVSGLENRVDVNYLRQNGAPYNGDVGGQLYLISRTTGRVQSYVMPATDLVNGRARAVIPQGEVKDPNGYNVQIIGTVDAEPRLIARGSASVFLTEALGVIPADIIDSIDLDFAYNFPASFDVALWQDTGKTIDYDVTPSAISAYVYDRMGGSIISAFTVTTIDNNEIRLTLTTAQVNALPPDCWWTLSVSAAAGTTTLAQGNVHIAGVQLPPFVPLETSFTYRTPAVLDEAVTGELVQGSGAPDILRISIYDDLTNDLTTTLARMVPGDEITLYDATGQPMIEPLVITSALNLATYYQFTVTPATPSDVVDGNQILVLFNKV